MAKYVDLTGQRFGKWLVTERLGGQSGNTKYLAQCACGAVFEVLGQNLLRGKSRSCGCGPRPARRLPEAGLRERFSRTKYSAKHRGIPFQLTEDHFKFLSVLACYYCGSLPSRVTFGRFKESKSEVIQKDTFISNGLDRIDPSLGYTQDNCVSCCTDCNRMKSDLAQHVFVSRVQKISRFSYPKGKELSMQQQIFLLYAQSLFGKPYIYGGDDPIKGLDCSGLAIELLQAAGVLPRGWDGRAQDLCNKFSREPAVPELGALCFYGTSLKAVTHVGVALDVTSMVEAGGGGPTTTTIEAAIKQNAYVRVRPINFRRDLVAVRLPTYPWEAQDAGAVKPIT